MQALCLGSQRFARARYKASQIRCSCNVSHRFTDPRNFQREPPRRLPFTTTIVVVIIIIIVIVVVVVIIIIAKKCQCSSR